ncbi:MAG: glycosyltransferase family 2 protein [Campylobacterota bacterium]|nr:glycosyltransferase family 2 protein [Campylobacterota bacterium]
MQVSRKTQVELTVFTPTFNRAYCIHQLYESLLRQTEKNFMWLVVDDGSTDNTREMVIKWQKEKKIDIRYIYQENQGMHGAHNTAYANIDTELNVCIDSDDFMTDNAVELILDKWNSIEHKSNISGIVGLDIDKKGNIQGKIPDNMMYSTWHDLNVVHKSRGDKKLVFRTNAIKKYPKYPFFENEIFVPLSTLYLMIDQDYKLACLHEALCVIEYMQDGSTLNIFKQYKRNPRGFRYARQIELTYIKVFNIQVKKVLHYISSTLFIKDYKFFKNNPKKVLTLICLPLGIFFHLYIQFKNRK